MFYFVSGVWMEEKRLVPSSGLIVVINFITARVSPAHGSPSS